MARTKKKSAAKKRGRTAGKKKISKKKTVTALNHTDSVGNSSFKKKMVGRGVRKRLDTENA